jgi:hypothetical protein
MAQLFLRGTQSSCTAPLSARVCCNASNYFDFYLIFVLYIVAFPGIE